MSTSSSNFRTPRSRAQGLGSAKHGVGHFVVERVSALASVPLVLWGVFAGLRLAGADHEGAVAWIGQPVNAVLLSLLLVVGLIHLKNAMQVVVEDYIEHFATKTALLLLNLFVSVLTGALGVFAIVKIALTGAI